MANSRKILNPYDRIKEHNCFGCSIKNELGLQMEFFEEEDYIKCLWEAKEQFYGYTNYFAWWYSGNING